MFIRAIILNGTQHVLQKEPSTRQPFITHYDLAGLAMSINTSFLIIARTCAIKGMLIPGSRRGDFFSFPSHCFTMTPCRTTDAKGAAGHFQFKAAKNA